MKKHFLIVPIILAMVIGLAGMSYGYSSYVTQFQTAYPNSSLSKLSTVSGQANNLCTVCHGPSGGSRNPFGSDFANAAIGNHSFNAALNGRDSDVDGATNKTEIDAGFRPGDRTNTPPPPPAACTGYTYSAWSTCVNNQQTRTVTGNMPANCTGTPPTQPVLTQACTPPPATGDTTAPTITSFELPVTFNGLTVPILSFTATDDVGVTRYKITRRSAKPSASKEGWMRTPPTSIRFEEAGVKTIYAWAKDAAGNVSLGAKAVVRITSRQQEDDDDELPEPSGQQVYGSSLRIAPLRADDLSKIIPASLGAISEDGSSMELLVSIGKFKGAVDVYVSLYRPSFDGLTPMMLYNLTSAGVFEEVVDAVLPWKTNVTDVNESITAGLPASGLPAGTHILRVGVTPAGSKDNYYQWYMPFTIQ